MHRELACEHAPKSGIGCKKNPRGEPAVGGFAHLADFSCTLFQTKEPIHRLTWNVLEGTFDAIRKYVEITSLVHCLQLFINFTQLTFYSFLF